MSHSGVSRYDFGPLFGIDHGDKPKVARAESVAFPTDLDDVAGTPRCRRERGHRGPSERHLVPLAHRPGADEESDRLIERNPLKDR